MCAKNFFEIFPLTEKVAVRITGWEVEEISSDQYALKARYAFERNGVNYLGESRFVKPLYLNQFSAIEALKEKAKLLDWSVWIDPENPAHSSLEKVFSTNLLFRAILSTIVTVYFFFSLTGSAQQVFKRSAK